ncbi:MAG: inward rectifier potassium channel [Planctomycetota bacterium]|jgi:inward rectifier potassium channel
MDNKIKDSGFRNQVGKGTAPIFNKDGSSNVIHANKEMGIDDLYSYLTCISWSKFFLLVLIGYVSLNVIFGLIYLGIGIEQITKPTENLFFDFLNGFFFSAQTITTVGYGSISPNGMQANIIATFQALIGLLSFSFITGLLYGRFSKPKSAIKFSENLVVRDFKDGRAIMFRLMNKRKSIMIEPEINVTLSINIKDENNNIKRDFYVLELERQKVTYLPTMWTVVHEIDKKSPLFNYTKEEMYQLDANMYVMIKYHEETFGQKVYQMTNYTSKDLLIDKKFAMSYEIDENGNTIIDHKKVNDTVDM